MPIEVDQWGWSLGFDPGQYRSGSAQTFDRARADFEAAWADLLPPAGAFEENGRDREYSAEISGHLRSRRKAAVRVPSSLMRCACGAIFDIHKPAESYDHRLHIYAAQPVRSSRSPTASNPPWTVASSSN